MSSLSKSKFEVRLELLSQNSATLRQKSARPRSLSSHNIGREACRRVTSKKIDADVRFSCGQVIVLDRLGPRHAKDHVTALHPQPWQGPLD